MFPVVGGAQLTKNWGAPRGGSSHQGEDIMAPKRAIAVAVEPGTVKFWTTSSRAGCMLYLYGRSGATYLYVHLNNDLRGNDNAGGCVGGVAYARGLKSGASVAAGEPLGFVGDSGDANSTAPHLHFEIHPRGSAVNPYPHLAKAKRLLFAAKPGARFTAALRGKVTAADADAETVTIDVDSIRSWPGGLRVPKVGRSIDVAMPPTAVITDALGALLNEAKAQRLRPGRPAVIWTEPATATLEAQLGEPYSLSAERVVLLDAR